MNHWAECGKTEQGEGGLCGEEWTDFESCVSVSCKAHCCFKLNLLNQFLLLVSNLII